MNGVQVKKEEKKSFYVVLQKTATKCTLVKRTCRAFVFAHSTFVFCCFVPLPLSSSLLTFAISLTQYVDNIKLSWSARLKSISSTVLSFP